MALVDVHFSWPLENPLDCKKIQPDNPKGNQSWIFIGRTAAEAETPILRPPDAKSSLICKESDAGMASPTRWPWVWASPGSWWWTGRPGVLQSWAHKESDTTEALSWAESLSFSAGHFSCFQSFPASRSFPLSWLFASDTKVLELQLQHQSFQWIFRVDFF